MIDERESGLREKEAGTHCSPHSPPALDKRMPQDFCHPSPQLPLVLSSCPAQGHTFLAFFSSQGL